MTLAKLSQKSKSFMASELIEAALVLPKYRALLDEAAETVGTVPTKEDPRDALGIQRRQPQMRVPKEEMTTTKGEISGKLNENLNALTEMVTVVSKRARGDEERPNFTKFYEELVEAKKQEQEAPPTRFKQALDLSDEQDKIFKTAGLDKVKPENRAKLIALMQLLETEDKEKAKTK